MQMSAIPACRLRLSYWADLLELHAALQQTTLGDADCLVSLAAELHDLIFITFGNSVELYWEVLHSALAFTGVLLRVTPYFCTPYPVV